MKRIRPFRYVNAMAQALVIALACLVGFAAAINWTDLRVKYDRTDGPNYENSYYPLPRTQEEAKLAKWTMPEEAPIDGKTEMWCPDQDPTICVLFDQKHTIVGYQLGITAEVDNDTCIDDRVRPKNQGFEKVHLYRKEFYVIQMLFVDPKTIDDGGREFEGTVGDDLRLTLENKLVKIPTKESELLSAVPQYVKQNCFPQMGQHYFYNANKTATPGDYKPFFLLYNEEHELHGLGMVMFGSKVEGDNYSRYYEKLPSAAVRMISPDTPDWVLEHIDKCGAYSQHIYFVPEPWNIACPAKAIKYNAY